jgi:enterochelin esterase-like enzyme
MPLAERLRDHLHPLLASVRVDQSGETDFWARIARERAPLIEPNPAQPGYSIVTYVFPVPPEARHVVVQPGFGEGRDHVMDRIPGANIGYASYSYRNDTRTSYSFAPDAPLISFDEASAAELEELRAFWEGSRPASDPHHRQHFVSRAGEGLPDDITSFMSLSDAPDESIVHKRPDIARGWIDRHDFASALMENQRRVWVYTPPGYKTGDQTYPLLVAFDGGQALSRIPTQRILDNLLADGRIRPVVAVFIDNPTPESRNTELPCNETFARFIEDELLPWVRRLYRVSDDPAEHFVTGASYGGLASMWLGYRLPHIFGNVISQAASLWWGPGVDMTVPFRDQRYTPEWLIGEYERAERLPVRFWMEVGSIEPFDVMIAPNRRMKAVLEAKGHDLIYSEPCGGHDYALWRGTLGAALAKMMPASA